jgi:hypothetical protein
VDSICTWSADKHDATRGRIVFFIDSNRNSNNEALHPITTLPPFTCYEIAGFSAFARNNLTWNSCQFTTHLFFKAHDKKIITPYRRLCRMCVIIVFENDFQAPQ